MGEQRDRDGKTILQVRAAARHSGGRARLGPVPPGAADAVRPPQARAAPGGQGNARAACSSAVTRTARSPSRDEDGIITRPAPMYRAVNRWKGREYVYYMCHGRGPETKTRKGCGNRVRLDRADIAADARHHARRRTARWWITGWSPATTTRPRSRRSARPWPSCRLQELHGRGVRRPYGQAAARPRPGERAEAGARPLRRPRDRRGHVRRVVGRLDTAGRSAFLARRRFRVYATKELVRVERGEGDWYQGAAYHRDLDDVVYVQAPREPSS